MTYSIKEVSKIFNLSIYTLRYYDKQGLLPFVSKNQSGYREFTESDLNLIHTICCLKNTGMPLKQIRTYIDYCMEGPVSIEARKQLLLDHRAAVLKSLEDLTENLKEVDVKIAKYSSPDAVEIITAERNYVSMEKKKHDLIYP
ncbi:MerR family transcriptional regulator, partial [Listeria monocytogenes]|nr:MerR family transcriptional regulator [Listeria monocytogenes]EAC6414763.1 MerR family transcriptional regulator [Listeria monocytogenes]EAC6951499.1 MerR family transcriptional regulator [Listeria monocytogenes]EAD1350806.1 MerR family transcriptional regulator [Listeria monocytogenes]EAD2619786.1 MerR family transcriptional regulator [Listeria monocytogenes]